MILDELKALAVCCQQGKVRYRAFGSSDPTCCIKLFRLALEERDEDAWKYLIDCYRLDVHNWFYRHPLSPQFSSHLDSIVNMTFTQLWDANKKKPIRVTTLGEVVNYLKLCFYTAINQHWRQERDWGKNIPLETLSPEGVLEEDAEVITEGIAVKELWKKIFGCTHTKLEKQIVILLWNEGCTVPQIVSRLASKDLKPAHIYTVVARIRRCLEKALRDQSEN
jgi:hypothetical protein